MNTFLMLMVLGMAPEVNTAEYDPHKDMDYHNDAHKNYCPYPYSAYPAHFKMPTPDPIITPQPTLAPPQVASQPKAPAQAVPKPRGIWERLRQLIRRR